MIRKGFQQRLDLSLLEDVMEGFAEVEKRELL